MRRGIPQAQPNLKKWPESVNSLTEASSLRWRTKTRHNYTRGINVIP